MTAYLKYLIATYPEKTIAELKAMEEELEEIREREQEEKERYYSLV